MTKQKIAIGLVVIALFAGVVTAHAAELSEGYKAIQRRDYETALVIFDSSPPRGTLLPSITWVSYTTKAWAWRRTTKQQ